MKERLEQARAELMAAASETLRAYWLVVIDSLVWNMREAQGAI